MIYSTYTGADLVDEVLANIYRVTEIPVTVVLATLSATEITLAADYEWEDVGVGDVLEFDSELMKVVAKSDDATPAFTVRRGWDGTLTAAHTVGTEGRVNPPFPRHRVLAALGKGVRKLEAWVPYIETLLLNKETDQAVVLVPPDTIAVLSVERALADTGKFIPLDAWRLVENLPANTFTTDQKAVMLPYSLLNDDDLYVTLQRPYRWNDPSVLILPGGWGGELTPFELGTINLPVGAELVPVAFATAYLAANREIGRLELDNTSEWSKSESARSLAPMTVIRELWAEFYRHLDEARRIHRPPVHRPFVPMPKRRRATWRYA